jgi:hypothetical protein
MFEQIFQITNLGWRWVKHFKYDLGFDLFDLRAALPRAPRLAELAVPLPGG